LGGDGPALSWVLAFDDEITDETLLLASDVLSLGLTGLEAFGELCEVMEAFADGVERNGRFGVSEDSLLDRFEKRDPVVKLEVSDSCSSLAFNLKGPIFSVVVLSSSSSDSSSERLFSRMNDKP
jgi:hypothetical protein